MKFRHLLVVWAALLLSSCATVKDIAYFQNKVVNHPEQIDKQAGIVIQPKDQISIVVSSRNPELVAMFNLPHITSTISADGGTPLPHARGIRPHLRARCKHSSRSSDSPRGAASRQPFCRVGRA